jgi:hypothetical protein
MAMGQDGWLWSRQRRLSIRAAMANGRTAGDDLVTSRRHLPVLAAAALQPMPDVLTDSRRFHPWLRGVQAGRRRSEASRPGGGG